jgi:hypothetical protein
MTRHTTRRSVLAAAGAVSLAGCLGIGGGDGDGGSSGGDGGGGSDGTGSGGENSGAGGGGGTTTDTPTDTPSTSEAGIPLAGSSLPVAWEFDHLRDETVSGGPPKDGIPSVDDPSFQSADEANGWLEDGDVVFGVVAGGEARAYPQRILVWHEITNDVLPAIPGDDSRSDVPVSITYCPLTGTTLGFERGETTFGVSGRLVNSNLVMYDRATDSRWPQVLGTAVRGRFEGRSLRQFPVVWTSWGQWRAAHPDTRVMTRETGYARDYNRDPYGSYNPRGGYYTGDNTLFGPLEEDDRLAAKAVVAGVRTPEGFAAFDKDRVLEAGTTTGDVGDVPHLAVHDPRFDAVYVYRNPDGLSFELSGSGADATVSGPDGDYAPGNLPLRQIPAFDAMWFAWAGFYPDTPLYQEGSA